MARLTYRIATGRAYARFGEIDDRTARRSDLGRHDPPSGEARARRAVLAEADLKRGRARSAPARHRARRRACRRRRAPSVIPAVAASTAPESTRRGRGRRRFTHAGADSDHRSGSATHRAGISATSPTPASRRRRAGALQLHRRRTLADGDRLAQTGWLALTDNPDERYRLAVSLKQPALRSRGASRRVLTPVHREPRRHRRTDRPRPASTPRWCGRFERFRTSRSTTRSRAATSSEYHFEDLASGEIDLLTFLTQVSQGLLDSLGTTLLSSNVHALRQPRPRRPIRPIPAAA